MRKSKPFAHGGSYDERRKQREPKPSTTYPEWIHCNQELREKIIADFEDAILETFGCFPKPNWMN